ncbi:MULTISPECIES: ABC transporter ATP-binding protein [Haloferax]|uniref:ABC transporter ATP-binding protein n=1 Tax=Haloferax TaxID=2251 RepID=UPI001CDA01F4|nr:MULTISPECIES: ABC transporter ATP-binding protein [Haloferax]
MTDDHQLTVRGLGKRFSDAFEIAGVDLTVGSDEIVALLGPSGCGKTTILRCIAGVETPDSGEITIGGETVYGDGVSRPPETRDIGMVYQNYAIWPHKTVYENVVFPLKHATHDVPRERYEERVDWMLELMEIASKRDDPATDLSGGQQQRTALARALVHGPDLLLLDEPLSNLDKELRKGMRYELQRLQHELDVSMLYVTHDQEEAFYLADRVVIVNDGEVVERGVPEELHRAPKTAFTRRFVGARNPFEGTIEPGSDGGLVVRTDLADVPLDRTDYMFSSENPGDVECFLRPEDLIVRDVDPAGRMTAADRPVETNGVVQQAASDGGETDGAIRQAASDGGETGGTVQQAASDCGETGPTVDGHVELMGTVVAEGILGDRYEVTVGFEGTDTELTVHCDDYRDFARGDPIRLGFDPGAMQVYRTTPDREHATSTTVNTTTQ